MNRLRFALRATGVVQLFFGGLFVVAPGLTASVLQTRTTEPGWVDWLFVMMGARFIGYGVGMFVAARDPRRHVAWINTMIAVQALDWASTLGFLLIGDVTLRNVTSAAVLPPLIMAALAWWHPGRTGDA
jgi:hypothetical protein